MCRVKNLLKEFKFQKTRSNNQDRKFVWPRSSKIIENSIYTLLNHIFNLSFSYINAALVALIFIRWEAAVSLPLQEPKFLEPELQKT